MTEETHRHGDLIVLLTNLDAKLVYAEEGSEESRHIGAHAHQREHVHHVPGHVVVGGRGVCHRGEPDGEHVARHVQEDDGEHDEPSPRVERVHGGWVLSLSRVTCPPIRDNAW